MKLFCIIVILAGLLIAYLNVYVVVTTDHQSVADYLNMIAGLSISGIAGREIFIS